MAFFISDGKSLVDTNTAIDIACSGLGRIELMGGGQGGFVLYRNAIISDLGQPERQICGRVFAPLSTIPEAVDLLLKAAVEAGLVHAVSLSRHLWH